MKRQRQTELPRFIVGALATAGASAANGATVQITFGYNVVSSSTGLTNFTADLTGDDSADVLGETGGSYYGILKNAAVRGPRVTDGSMVVSLAGAEKMPWYLVNYRRGPGRFTSVTGESQAVIRGLAPLAFKDDRINGGEWTFGWLDVQATANDGGVGVQIHRLIFDDESTTAPTGVTSATTGLTEVNATYGVSTSAVPEPSGLALLALGAGGLLARRSRAKAAA